MTDPINAQSPLATETLTWYVQRDTEGRVVMVTNALAAEQGMSHAESVTVPTEDAVRAVLASVEGIKFLTRHEDLLTWSVTPERGYNAHVLAERIRRDHRWPASAMPSGSGVFFWPSGHIHS